MVAENRTPMRRILALLMIIAVAASAAGPASAAKKKPTGPKPYKSEEVTLQYGHTVQYGNTQTVVGVTPQEFINTCALPSTNGLDAYVWEVPEAYKNIDAAITAFGSGGTLGYDLDIFLFDEHCAITFASESTIPDESTVVPKGTAYILIHNFGWPSSPYGGGSDAVTAYFELKPHSI